MNIAILTPVWGERYIAAFAEVGLPSLLAPNNIERIRNEHNVELVFLTSTSGRAVFESLEALRKAKKTCSIRYVIIDDLISSANYGVTLTLAYARGMAAYGDRQTSTSFIFFNSDFVVSDGSLSTVVRMLQEGHRCIIAPSLRVNAEATFPVLSQCAAKHEYTLPMQSREMVHLALRNLHITVIGRTLTQDFVHCSQHGQFYWAVDKDTLVGAHHLIFHIAIRPEKPLTTVNSYHDYCFVPEMIPTGQFTLIDDSDDFFMIEMQAQMQEKEMLRCGRTDPNTMADELSTWATLEHRRFARVPVVFHAKDAPAETVVVKLSAQKFVDHIQAMMINPPVSHAFHQFWIQGVAAWAVTKTADGNGKLVVPPELKGQVPEQPTDLNKDTPVAATAACQSLGRKAKMDMQLRHIDSGLFGVPIWHHRWRDVRSVDLLVKQSHDPTWLVSDEQPNKPTPNLRVFHSLDELLNAAATEQKPARVVLHVLRERVRTLRPMLSRIGETGLSSQEIVVFIDHLDSEADPSNFSYELAQYASDTMPDDWLGYNVSTTFTGGRIRRLLMRTEGMVWRIFLRSGSRFKSAVFGGLWLGLRLPILWLNIWSRDGSNPCPDFCSSAVLRLQSRRQRSDAHSNSTYPDHLRNTGFALRHSDVTPRTIGGSV